jgi:FixJ family two-component response regulator
MAQPTVVIVVDDNAGILKGVARLLAHDGIDSRTFASADALLESDSVQTGTCLLLDIHLGGISGIELRRRLRHRDRNARHLHDRERRRSHSQ